MADLETRGPRAVTRMQAGMHAINQMHALSSTWTGAEDPANMRSDSARPEARDDATHTPLPPQVPPARPAAPTQQRGQAEERPGALDSEAAQLEAQLDEALAKRRQLLRKCRWCSCREPPTMPHQRLPPWPYISLAWPSAAANAHLGLVPKGECPLPATWLLQRITRVPLARSLISNLQIILQQRALPRASSRCRVRQVCLQVACRSLVLRQERECSSSSRLRAFWPRHPLLTHTAPSRSRRKRIRLQGSGGAR
jgi:hypothetical protein